MKTGALMMCRPIVGKNPADRIGTVCRAERVAARTFGESFGEFGKDLQVLFGGLFRNQQNEQQRDGFAVRRVKRNRGGQAQKRATGFPDALDATVWNGDASTEAGRTELFTRKKAVEYRAAGNPLVVFKEQTSALEDALFTARVKVKDDVFRG